MNGLFDFISTSSSNKVDNTQREGITSIIDCGLGLKEFSDTLQIGSQYIDVIKLAFGSAVVTPYDIVIQKIATAKSHDCILYFGGTLFEIAMHQGKFSEYLLTCRQLGLAHVEISDGAINFHYQVKLDCIKKACDSGFTVYSEIGKKNPYEDSLISISQRIDMISQELECGSEKIIIEARESGTVGLFTENKKIKKQAFTQLISDVDHENLIFEAPDKSGQTWFINELGHKVNLGNISPRDVISLECLRQKLRADTLCL